MRTKNNNAGQVKTIFWQKAGLILLGLFLTLIFLEIGLRFMGFCLTCVEDYRNQISIRQKGAYRILCLGDSTTRAQYPQYLETLLNQNHSGIKFSVVDRGIRSVNSSQILSNLRDNLDHYKPEMVIVMMGVNDDESHLPYGAVFASSQQRFWESFRCYKLIRLLGLHLTTKFGKKRSPGPIDLENGGAGLPLKESDVDEGKVRSERKNFPAGDRQNLENVTEHDSYADHMRLGHIYRKQDDLLKSENEYKRALEINPKSSEAYQGLMTVYRTQEVFTAAEKVFAEAMKLGLVNAELYYALGKVFQDQDHFAQAEKLFKKSLELDPNGYNAYIMLARVSQRLGEFLQAEEAYKHAMALEPMNPKPYGGLWVLYDEMGKIALAEEYNKKAKQLRRGYHPITVQNFLELKRILDDRGIKLVCMQYPMRELAPLKAIFEEPGDILFVDNEKLFKDAVKKEGFRKYFRDVCAGDFGHCTPKGNKLLAENIARALSKELGIG